MTTRLKAEVKKSKVMFTPQTILAPKTVKEALKDKGQFAAMKNEFEALVRNNTWVLVPSLKERKIIDNKWPFSGKGTL